MIKDPEERSPSPPRVVIEDVEPQIDAGRFPIKRVIGERVCVSARIFTEGHDRLAAVVRVRQAGEEAWQEIPMREETHDRWEAEFSVERLGRCEYTVEAWVDGFGSWRERLAKKHQAGHDVRSELLEGAELVRQAGGRAAARDASWLEEQAGLLSGDAPAASRVTLGALGGAPRARRRLSGPQPRHLPRGRPRGPSGTGAGPLGSVVRILPAFLRN